MRPSSLLLSRTAVTSIGATFLMMGLVVSAYGPLLEHLTRRFSVSLPVAGATISIHFTGALLGVLVAMRSIQIPPARMTVMGATGVISVGSVGVALAPSWSVFVVGVFLIGLGFGALVLALNQVVAYSEGQRRAALLNGLNGLYSAGAVMGPILVAVFAREHFAALFLGVAALALCLIPVYKGISGQLPFDAAAPSRPSVLVLIFVVAFVLYVGMENGIGGWMTSHLESTGLRSAAAATLTSAFWFALMTGRLLITIVPARISEASIVLTGAAIGTAALLVASFGPAAPWAYVATGLVVGPIFPTAVVWLARLNQGDARATSWLFPAATVGGIIGPGAIGLVIAGFGIGWTPEVLGLVGIGMCIAFWSANRFAKRPA